MRQIGLILVLLGALLVLIAFGGAKIKFGGAEIEGSGASRSRNFLAGVFGLALIATGVAVAFQPGHRQYPWYRQPQLPNFSPTPAPPPMSTAPTSRAQQSIAPRNPTQPSAATSSANYSGQTLDLHGQTPADVVTEFYALQDEQNYGAAYALPTEWIRANNYTLKRWVGEREGTTAMKPRIIGSFQQNGSTWVQLDVEWTQNSQTKLYTGKCYLVQESEVWKISDTEFRSNP